MPRHDATERLDGQQDRHTVHNLLPGHKSSADEIPLRREQIQHGAARLSGLRDIPPRGFVHNLQYDEPVFRFRRTVASILPNAAGQTVQTAQGEAQPSSAEQISSRIHDPYCLDGSEPTPQNIAADTLGDRLRTEQSFPRLPLYVLDKFRRPLLRLDGDRKRRPDRPALPDQRCRLRAV